MAGTLITDAEITITTLLDGFVGSLYCECYDDIAYEMQQKFADYLGQ